MGAFARASGKGEQLRFELEGRYPENARGEMNKEWHACNRMPKNATLDQRIEWHKQHARHCGCRKIPSRIAKEIKKQKSQLQHSPADASH